MRKVGNTNNYHLEHTIHEILKSKAQSKIYLFLLRKKNAKTEEIIRGTRLHPSTVRETLVKMYCKHLIIRKKYKNDSIGKNPYLYSPLPPIKLIKKYVEDMEQRLNDFASLSKNQWNNSSIHSIQIRIIEQEDMQ